MGDNSGSWFKQLVNAILKDEDFAEELLGADEGKRNSKLQKYLDAAQNSDDARAKLAELVADTDYLNKIRILASRLDPGHPSSIDPDIDAPI